VNDVSPARKIVAIAVPWVFLALFAAIYMLVAVPRVLEGHVLAMCVGAFVALVFVVFFVAAITFSRDVVLNRWPEPPV
jgi:ABC-type protease/lipase transport system fused ATPase/permease subunit